MKNYAMNKLMEDEFILNYIMVDENIIVNMASGKKMVYPYSNKNEIMILERMKKQVIDYYYVIYKTKNNLIRSWVIESFMILFLVFNFYVILSKKTDTLIANKLLEIVFSIIGISYLKQIIDDKSLINDIKKNYLFIQNEELFRDDNLYIGKINKNLSMIKKITLNDMDYISLRDLKRLINNNKEIIKRIKK